MSQPQSALEALAERLRANPVIRRAPAEAQKLEIKLGLMEIPGADPDAPALVDFVLDLMRTPKPAAPVLERICAITGLSDGAIAEMIGKSRPTVQAYRTGRIKENLDDAAREALAKVVRKKIAEIDGLLHDLDA